MRLLDTIIISTNEGLELSLDGIMMLLIGLYGPSSFYRVFENKTSSTYDSVNLYFNKDGNSY